MTNSIDGTGYVPRMTAFIKSVDPCLTPQTSNLWAENHEYPNGRYFVCSWPLNVAREFEGKSVILNLTPQGIVTSIQAI